MRACKHKWRREHNIPSQHDGPIVARRHDGSLPGLAPEPSDCDDAKWAGVGGFYNEIVMDKYHLPWEPDLASLIEAVFIAPSASSASLAYARAVQRALAGLLPAAPPPLLIYDASAASNPFVPAPGF